MSPLRRIICACSISVCFHLVVLIAVTGRMGGQPSVLELPGLLFVELIKLGGKGAEARVVPELTPFSLASPEAALEVQPRVPAALGTERSPGNGTMRDRSKFDTGGDSAFRERALPAEEPLETEFYPLGVRPEEPAYRRTGRANPPAPGASDQSVSRCLHCPNPAYPPLAEKRGLEGEVAVRFQVLPDGRVGDIFVEKSSGFPILDEAAMAGVKQWSFVPAVEDGASVPSVQRRTIIFELTRP